MTTRIVVLSKNRVHGSKGALSGAMPSIFLKGWFEIKPVTPVESFAVKFYV